MVRPPKENIVVVKRMAAPSGHKEDRGGR